MFFIVAIFSLLYFLLIFSYLIKWNKYSDNFKIKKYQKVSVIIAMRNEEINVNNILNDLKNQLYPKELYEVIVVNDHSDDNTLNLLNEFSNKFQNLRIVNMPEHSQGKKECIKKGIEISFGNVIITTDADCRIQTQWIEQMAKYFNDSNINLVSAPVVFNKKPGLFFKIQELEFISLIGSGAGAILNNRPIFCNAANMAFRKSVFLSVSNYFKNQKSVSGDDVFLLHAVKKYFPNTILFAKNKKAIIHTESQNNLSSFINQRKRWVAKTTHYKDLDTITVSILIFIVNLIIILLFFLTLINTKYIVLFLMIIIPKSVIDFYFLRSVLDFLNKRELIKYILPFEIFYSFYITLMPLIAFTNSFTWKNRKHYH